MKATAGLPTGTVTFLFTDIEGSTRLLQELGEVYRTVQDQHSEIVRRSVAGAGGTEVRTEGDSFFAAFLTPRDAVSAAVVAQRSLASNRWPHGRPLRVRMGLHTGEAVLGGGDYLGIDVNRAARIAAAAAGGQILLSENDHAADARRPSRRRRGPKLGPPPAEGSRTPRPSLRRGVRGTSVAVPFTSISGGAVESCRPS